MKTPPAPKIIKTSAASLHLRYLTRLFEHLPKTDADRLEAILPLFDPATHESPMAACLGELFPGRPADEAQAAFRSYRDRLKKAGCAAGVFVTLEVDNRKKLPPTQRLCWFEAPDDAEQKAAEFSKAGAELDLPARIESRAITTTGEALEAGQTPVHFYVSYDATDGTLAAELRDELRSHFKASKRYAYDIWDHSHILPGEDRERETSRAWQEADFVLVLVSPTYFGNTA